MTNQIKTIGAILFPLGQIVSTRGAMDVCSPAYLLECLSRHCRGDFGKVCQEDWQSNLDAIEHGCRILSSYPIDPSQPSEGFGKNTVWIITEADRSVTTFLLPNEY